MDKAVTGMPAIDAALATIRHWPDLFYALLASLGLSVGPGTLSWSILQLAIAGLAFMLAVLLDRRLTPHIKGFLNNSGWRWAALRVASVVLRRLRVILFALLVWFAVVAMRASTWDSRSYFLQLLATLLAAWATISITSRLIRNRSLARLVEIGGWIVVTLSLLGVLPAAMALLDSVAITVNTLRISPLVVLQGAIILWVLVWAAVLVSRFFDRRLNDFEDLTPAMRVLLSKAIRFSLVLLAFTAGLYAVGVDFTALTLISGALGVGLGFGLQKVVSNLVSGIILLLDKSIKPGDVITVGETFGWITALNARYVSVSMRDGREILIPNEDLITQQVQNWSFQDPFVRIDITFGVSYDSDPHLVRDIAKKAAQDHARVITTNPEYPVVCHLTGFGDSSIDFVLRFFIADPVNGLTNVRGDVFLALWDTFKAHAVSIPFPHREVIMHQAPASQGAPSHAPPTPSPSAQTGARSKKTGANARTSAKGRAGAKGSN